jgi:hypothetical protein
MKRYYMIHAVGYPSNIEFSDYDEAYAQATSLASQNPGIRFGILELVAVVQGKRTDMLSQ